ncbi:YbjN domain-containing protein [Corynebacterium timonense]|uniref:Sensory transduction regulator n=1 Tax=Corynebacterium timonense TaxID=441500 RepID=A0A1H1NQT2_9CORY|nr:YbjN domain-containing protein [Corynebacterium timonense]SDS01331.1 hypothetical protein SAMN04488539_0838 [Corynebacterium timonense]
MTQDSPHPDDPNAPAAVGLGAVAAIFDEENLEYRLDDEYLRSGFINAAIVVALDGDTLVFEAVWRGEFPVEMASQVLFACNEHNQTHFAPTLRFFENGPRHLAASAIRTMDVSQGASFNQLGAFVVSSIEATLQAFDYLAVTFPTLVTWEETHDEH